MMDLEIINRLYLELSQIATATTRRELDLEREIAELRRDRERLKEMATGLMFVCFAEANRMANHGVTGMGECYLYKSANEAKRELAAIEASK